MVRKFLGFLYQEFLDREITHLNQAALLLGLFAFLSQVIAFLRDRLLAHIFGASIELDIYYAAFRIPDFIFVTVASVVSLSVLVPFILEKGEQGRESLREFINSVFSFFWLLILVASALAYFLIPALSTILFKGFSAESLEQVVFLSRLLLLSPVILGLSNLLGSITQAYNRFTTYAVAPLLYNAGIIIGIVTLAERLGVLGVAIGVCLGAASHALVQAPFVWKTGLLPRFSFRFDTALIKKVVSISVPRTLTLSMSSLAILFLVSLASLMTEGSISVLSFSFNLSSVPLSLIGVSYSLAAFPTLTRRFQENNLPAFLAQMAISARFIIFWSLPLTALLVVERAQIVRVLLGTGLFDWPATRLTAAALALFVASSVFQSLLLLFMRGFYSAGVTLKPFFINLVSTGILALSAYGLVKWFYASELFRFFISSLLKVEDLPNSAVLMLPLGFSIGIIMNTVILWAAFEWQFRGFSYGIIRTLFTSTGSSVIMGAMTYMGLNFFEPYFNTATLMGLFLQGLSAGIMGIFGGVVVLAALKSSELTEIWSVVRGKFWKAKVIATDPEIV